MNQAIGALFVCAWLCAGCAASTQHGAGSSQKRWTQIDTLHFSMSTNLDDRAALAMARSLEEARAALLALAWTGARDPRGRTPVVVFARPAEFQHYVGRPRIAGIATAWLMNCSEQRICIVSSHVPRASGASEAQRLSA